MAECADSAFPNVFRVQQLARIDKPTGRPFKNDKTENIDALNLPVTWDIVLEFLKVTLLWMKLTEL